MRVLFAAFLLLLVGTAAVFAQTDKTKRIKEIRDYYTKVSNEIERIEKDEEAAFQSELAVNELVVNKLNKSWPAVGNYTVIYRFYYKQMGEDHYPSHLVKVTKKTVSAARTYYQEYLFEENGELMFSFAKDSSGEDLRLYYKDGKFLDYKGSGDRLLAAASSSGAVLKAGELKEMFRLSID